MKMCKICMVACGLMVVGALNWGLVGIFDFNLVSAIFGEVSTASRVIYGLVGVAGLMTLIKCFKGCPACPK